MGMKTRTSNNFQKSGAQRMQPKSNPFDSKVNKSKFNVLNKNSSSLIGHPSQAKTRSLERRKRTILSELNRRGRTGDFIDRRFGERNPTLSSEEKMLERFRRERMRTNKRRKGIFNLGSEEMENSYNLSLTHRGKDVGDLDSFDSGPEDSDLEEDSGTLDADIVSKAHFGNIGTEGTKSKSEIMQEIIAKSKKHKIERQKLREENQALCDDLDAEFHSILANGALSIRHGSDKKHRPPIEEDDYYEVVRAMAFERRGQPTDRTRDAGELQKERLDRIKEEQEEKTKRMERDVFEDNSNADEETEDRNKANEEKDECITDAERSLRKVMDQVKSLIAIITSTTSLDDANSAYAKIATLSRTNSVIPVARVVRDQLGKIVSQIKSSLKNGKGPIMPSRDALLLFHMIGCIFSTSDYHHIVVTPAMLLISSFLEKGRLLKKYHVLSALFLIQTILSYTSESKRISPEVFSLLFPLLRILLNSAESSWRSPYSNDRIMSKSVHEFLSYNGHTPLLIQPRSITFEDLFRAEKDTKYLTKDMITSFLIYLLELAIFQYKGNMAVPELFLPFIHLLKSSQFLSDTVVRRLEETILERQRDRKPLLMQKHKPISIPSLVPDVDDDCLSRGEKEHRRLHQTYKREFKGAKRELRRDSAFVANQKLQMKLEADRKYNERIRRIIGSIANESVELKTKKSDKK